MADAPANANPAANADTKFWEGLKWTAQLLGIVGGGGSGFAALSFGIGYLAIKHHDAMLGLPTTNIPYTTYVRTGALFFTTALQSMVTVLTPLSWGAIVLALIVVLLLLLGRMFGLRLSEQKRALRAQAILLALCSVLVLVFSFKILPMHAAPLEPMNRELLLIEDRPAVAEQDTQAFQVWEQLRRDDGEKWLQKRFGLMCASVFVLLYLAWLFRRWRHSQVVPTNGGDAVVTYCLGMSDWIVRPLQFGVVLVMLAILPANYGVLGLSNHYPCVQLWMEPAEAQAAGVAKVQAGKSAAESGTPAAKSEGTAPPSADQPPAAATAGQAPAEPPKTLTPRQKDAKLVNVGGGYLLSDLTAEPEAIVLLERERGAGKLILQVYKRAAIRKIDVASCSTKSILVIK